VIGLLIDRFPRLGKIMQYPAALIVGASRVVPVGGAQTRTMTLLSAGFGAMYGWGLRMDPKRGAAIGAIAGAAIGLTAEFIGKSSARVFHRFNNALRRALGFIPHINDFTRFAATVGLLGGGVAGALRARDSKRDPITLTLFYAVLGGVATGKAAWLAQDLVALRDGREKRPHVRDETPIAEPLLHRKRTLRTWWQRRKGNGVERIEIKGEKLPRFGIEEEHERCWQKLSPGEKARFARAYEDSKDAITKMCQRLGIEVPAISHRIWLTALTGPNQLGPSMGARSYNAAGESFIRVGLDTAKNVPYSDLVSTMVHELFHAELSATRMYGKTTAVAQCGLSSHAVGPGAQENRSVEPMNIRTRALDEAVSEFLTLHATKASNLSGYRFMEAKLEAFNRKLPRNRRDDFLRVLLQSKRDGSIRPLYDFLVSVGAPAATWEERAKLGRAIFDVRLDQIALKPTATLGKVA
jgi:hypothetical protein